MAAFLRFAPKHGVSTTAEAIARMDNAVTATPPRQESVRPTLICHWTQGADGRLSCYWECALPHNIPTPPH